MSGSICSKRYVIGVVRVPNSLCGVSFASFVLPVASLKPFSFMKSINVLSA